MAGNVIGLMAVTSEPAFGGLLEWALCFPSAFKSWIISTIILAGTDCSESVDVQLLSIAKIVCFKSYN